MSYIPSIIAPVYLGIRKIILQEKSKFTDKKFNDDGTFFTRKSYKDYFCEKILDSTKVPTSDELFNDNEDVEELFKTTQKFIDKTKHVKIKKRKSYALRMSANKPPVETFKNTSIESPVSNDNSFRLKIPRIAHRKKSKKVRINRLSSSKNSGGSDTIKESSNSIMRQSLGTEKLNQDFFSFFDI